MMTGMTRKPAADSAIARIAGRQHGLVTRGQLLDAGVTESQRRHRVNTGRLVRVGPGRYRVAGAPLAWEQRALDACLAGGDCAVLCRRSAAVAWHLDLPVPRVIDVATPDRHGRPPARGEVRIHRVRSLAADDRTSVGALPVTTVTRTLIDLAGELDPTVLRRVVDAALVERLVTPRRLDDAMARLGGRGRKGFGALRSAMAPTVPPVVKSAAGAPELESVCEAAALRVLAAAGLPAPVCQYVISTPDGQALRLDFAWPDRRVALEVDGFRWHGGPRERDRDSRRTNTLFAMGWIVIRTTPHELASAPGPVLDALRRGFGA
jgi:hypothetical protein